jgi:hypothetical protein
MDSRLRQWLTWAVPEEILSYWIIRLSLWGLFVPFTMFLITGESPSIWIAATFALVEDYFIWKRRDIIFRE